MLKAPEAAGLWVEQRPGCSASRGRASVIAPISATREGHGVRLEPLAPAHEHDLPAAAADGRLWQLLLAPAWEGLGCKCVGSRADNFNFASQRAIAALGARLDGVIRHHQARRDGTVRDSVMYSILRPEWPDVKRHLATRLSRHPASADRGGHAAPQS